jgi:hypothetical protein
MVLRKRVETLPRQFARRRALEEPDYFFHDGRVAREYEVDVVGHDRAGVDDESDSLDDGCESPGNGAGLQFVEARRGIQKRLPRFTSLLPVIRLIRERASLGGFGRGPEGAQVLCPDLVRP